MTPIGKRIVYIIVNLTIGENQVKKNVEWLGEKNVMINSKSDQRIVQNIIHHRKISRGKNFQKMQ